MKKMLVIVCGFATNSSFCADVIPSPYPTPMVQQFDPEKPEHWPLPVHNLSAIDLLLKKGVENEVYRKRLEQRQEELRAQNTELLSSTQWPLSNPQSTPPQSKPVYTHNNPPPPITIPRDEPRYEKFSDKAIELIQEYTRRVLFYRPQAVNPVMYYYPPLNLEKHVNEEYRPAWEEIFRECVTDEFQAKLELGADFSGVTWVNALSIIASTNSIPALLEVYKVMQAKDKKYYQRHHRDIWSVLLQIGSPEALDAVFSLLDLSDAELGTGKRYNDYRDFLTLRDEFLKDIEKNKPNLAKFDAYQNPNLSEKNQIFFEKARNLTRAREDQNEEPQP